MHRNNVIKEIGGRIIYLRIKIKVGREKSLKMWVTFLLLTNNYFDILFDIYFNIYFTAGIQLKIYAVILLYIYSYNILFYNFIRLDVLGM